MDDRAKQTFEFAADAVKQLLTLSAAILTLTIGFADKLPQNAPRILRWAVVTTWVLYLLSAIAGIFTLQALSGALHDRRQDDHDNTRERPPSIDSKNISTPWSVQVYAFILAIALTVLVGSIALLQARAPVPAPPVVVQCTCPATGAAPAARPPAPPAAQRR